MSPYIQQRVNMKFCFPVREPCAHTEIRGDSRCMKIKCLEEKEEYVVPCSGNSPARFAKMVG